MTKDTLQVKEAIQKIYYLLQVRVAIEKNILFVY